jgi:NAD(P)-dependent dehydrogenase (short-subunit alcohol dehydrogenase family)
MSTEFNLSGRSALITGAGKRLGRAFTEALAKHGADVAVHYGRSADAAEETASIAREYGVKAVTLQADLAQSDETLRLIESSIQHLGKVDILINNAAIFEPQGILDTSIEVWERHIAINLTAPFLLSRAFAQHRADESGVIINLLDWRALRPGPDHFAYNISKAGLAAMTQSLAQTLAPNIRVNGLSLGAILPPPDAESYDEAIIEGVPAGRWGTVEETIHAMLFLIAGPNFITGEILQLDGGRHLT